MGDGLAMYLDLPRGFHKEKSYIIKFQISRTYGRRSYRLESRGKKPSAPRFLKSADSLGRVYFFFCLGVGLGDAVGAGAGTVEPWAPWADAPVDVPDIVPPAVSETPEAEPIFSPVLNSIVEPVSVVAPDVDPAGSAVPPVEAPPDVEPLVDPAVPAAGAVDVSSTLLVAGPPPVQAVIIASAPVIASRRKVFMSVSLDNCGCDHPSSRSGLDLVSESSC